MKRVDSSGCVRGVDDGESNQQDGRRMQSVYAASFRREAMWVELSIEGVESFVPRCGPSRERLQQCDCECAGACGRDVSVAKLL